MKFNFQVALAAKKARQNCSIPESRTRCRAVQQVVSESESTQHVHSSEQLFNARRFTPREREREREWAVGNVGQTHSRPSYSCIFFATDFFCNESPTRRARRDPMRWVFVRFKFISFSPSSAGLCSFSSLSGSDKCLAWQFLSAVGRRLLSPRCSVCSWVLWREFHSSLFVCRRFLFLLEALETLSLCT